MSHIDHSAEYWYFYLSEIDMCHLELERASLLVIRYANHLHAIGITRGLRHYQGHHMRLFENQKNTAVNILQNLFAEVSHLQFGFSVFFFILLQSQCHPNFIKLDLLSMFRMSLFAFNQLASCFV